MVSNEIRICLFYEFKLGHTAADAYRNIISVWGSDALGERNTRIWFARFTSGDFDLENEDRGRPPILVDHGQLKTLIEDDPTKTVRELASDLDVSPSTISRHLAQIGKVKKLDKWVPHHLNDKQTTKRYHICTSLLLRQKNEPFMHRLITCDEKWLLYDNHKRSARWLDVDEAPKHSPKPKLHMKKVMVTVWWSMQGVIHYSFLKVNQTIDAVKYCQDIDIVHRKLAELQPALVNRKGPILLQDNARPHVSKLTLQKLSQLGIEVLPHPPYSPDLAPTDYHLFKHLTHFMKDKQFTKDEDVKQAFIDFIESRTPDFFSDGMNKLLTRWQKCLDTNGNYFD